MILLRRGGRHTSAGLEVLLGKRTSRARFMADVWVFPGGAVDGESNDDDAHRQTALRELEEEAGVTLPDPAELVPFSRWITPEQVKVRYDTRFYLALAPAHSTPEPDGEEIVETRWFAPVGGARAAPAAASCCSCSPRSRSSRRCRDTTQPEEALTGGACGERRADPAARRRVRRRAAHPAAGRSGVLNRRSAGAPGIRG